jgi:hypothetical protein
MRLDPFCLSVFCFMRLRRLRPFLDPTNDLSQSLGSADAAGGQGGAGRAGRVGKPKAPGEARIPRADPASPPTHQRRLPRAPSRYSPQPRLVVTHLLLLFIAADDAGGPASAAMLRALAEVLGAGVHIEVRGYQAPPSDDDLAAAGRSAHAESAARLLWNDEGHTRAEVRVHLAATGQTHGQSVTFEPSDPEAERGRAVGFVIASFLLPGLARPPPTPASSPALTAIEPPRPAPPTRPARWALEAFGSAGLPVHRDGTSFGGGVAARLLGARGWSVRLGGRLRAGEVAAAQASLLTIALSAGGSLVVAGGASPSRPTLALRTEVLALYETLTHFSSDDPVPVRRGRWLPGGAALLELSWPLAPGVAVQVGAGTEAAFGETSVYLHDDEVARLSAVRVVAELGFQARF